MTLSTIHPVFETETCGRCGGSGHYSFNMMDGTVCYGCSGTKVRYTKRGKAALAKFEAFKKTILEVTAADIKPGMHFSPRRGTRYFVKAIHPDPNPGYITFETAKTFYGMAASTKVNRMPTVSELETIANYTATLKGVKYVKWFYSEKSAYPRTGVA